MDRLVSRATKSGESEMLTSTDLADVLAEVMVNFSKLPEKGRHTADIRKGTYNRAIALLEGYYKDMDSTSMPPAAIALGLQEDK